MLTLQRTEEPIDLGRQLGIADLELRQQAPPDFGTIVISTEKLPEPGAGLVQDEDPIRFDVDQDGLLTEPLRHGVGGGAESRRVVPISRIASISCVSPINWAGPISWVGSIRRLGFIWSWAGSLRPLGGCHDRSTVMAWSASHPCRPFV
jgi:hypothetical protein